MANRYNPPQKRPPHSTANYFTPLTLSSSANINTNINTNASASRVTTAPSLPQTAELGPVTNIHAQHIPQPHTTSQPQSQTLPSPFPSSTMNLTSDLRGDSNPYTPLPAHSMASHSTITTTPIHHNTTAPHQTSRPQPTGLANTPAAQQPIWPTPSPRFHKPLPSQHTPTSASTPSSAQKPPKPSVKHLTCYFWSEFGHCQWSSADCLYAHAYTGKVASAPVQVEVGKPAVAGRNAESAKPRYEEWRPAAEKSTAEGNGTPASASPSHHTAPAPSSSPLPVPTFSAAHQSTGDDPGPHTAILVDAVKTLSAALHEQQTRVVGMKEALVEHCQAMLDLAQAMNARGLPIEEFVDRSMVFVDCVAEQGREAEELAVVLGRVRARLEGAGLRGVVEMG